MSCLLVAFMSDQVLDLLPLRHMVAHGFLKAGMFLVLAQAVIRAPYQRMTALDPHTRPMLTCMWSVGWLHSIVCDAGDQEHTVEHAIQYTARTSLVRHQAEVQPTAGQSSWNSTPDPTGVLPMGSNHRHLVPVLCG